MSKPHLAACLLVLVTLVFEFSLSAEISTFGKAYSTENPNLEVELKNLSPNDLQTPAILRGKRMKLFLNANIARFRPENDESLNHHFWPIWDFMLRQHKPPKNNPKHPSKPLNEKNQEKGTLIRHSLKTKWKTTL